MFPTKQPWVYWKLCLGIFGLAASAPGQDKKPELMRGAKLRKPKPPIATMVVVGTETARASPSFA